MIYCDSRECDDRKTGDEQLDLKPEVERLKAAIEQDNGTPTPADTALDELTALVPHLPNPKEMTNAQKEKEKAILRERLKALNAVPRSDWHESFENIVQLEVEHWNNGTKVEREVSIGEGAPRTDFIVVTGERLPDFVKSVFRIFLKKNALEYKRPDDVLIEAMVWKTAGYGNLLIGTEKDYDKDELTLTIFAYKKNKKQFTSMVERGIISATEVKGIYTVNGLTRLPYQVVIIDELEGTEYAAFRALSDHATVEDVQIVLATMKETTVVAERDRYHNILQTIEIHNPGAVKEMIVEDRSMRSVFLDVLKPEIDEMTQDAVTNSLFQYVSDGAMPVDYAAKQRGLTPDAFVHDMTAAGYKVPQQQPRP